VSDLVTDGPLPAEIKNSMSAWAGCIAGALDIAEYVAAIEAAGFEQVSFTPAYMDKVTVDRAVEEFGLDEAARSGNGAQYKTVFSAKVTAWKPLDG
jgi:hypothetical protein